MDSQDGLNYLGRIIACCSMRIVSRTGGVVVCTLSLHAEGPWFKSWQVAIWIWSRGAIPHLVVHIDFESGREYTFGGAYGFGVGVKFHF